MIPTLIYALLHLATGTSSPRASLRRFREAIGNAVVTIGPVQVQLNQPEAPRAEPAIKAPLAIDRRRYGPGAS